VQSSSRKGEKKEGTGVKTIQVSEIQEEKLKKAGSQDKEKKKKWRVEVAGSVGEGGRPCSRHHSSRILLVTWGFGRKRLA